MLTNFINHRMQSIVISAKPLVAFRSASDMAIANRMKELNDKKQFKKVFQLFDEYKKNNPKILSNKIVTQALKACAQIGDLRQGSTIHRLMSSQTKNDPYILVSLIHLYMQYGDVRQAESLFGRSSNQSLQSYGAMMKGYVKNNQAQKAIDLFHKINNPDEIIIVLLFNVCAQLVNTEALNLAKQVSAIIPKSFYSNPFLSNSLLDASIKCGDSSFAETLFPQIRRSVDTYASLMTDFDNENNPRKTLELFHQMKKIDGIQLNAVTYLCVIKALSQIGDDPLCELILQDIPHSMLIDNKIHGVLIDMFGKTANIDHAKELFQKKTQPYFARIQCNGSVIIRQNPH